MGAKSDNAEIFRILVEVGIGEVGLDSIVSVSRSSLCKASAKARICLSGPRSDGLA